MGKLTRQATLEQRNQAIYSSLKDGVDTASLAAQYRLSDRTIRSIGQRMADRYAADVAKPGSGGAFGEIGRSGLKESNGYIHEEFLSELNSSSKRYKIFNEMRQNSPIAFSGLQAIELSILGVDFHIEADTECEEEDERAEFLQSCVDDMSHSLKEHLREALTMLPFGFSPFEIVYKKRQGENNAVPSQYDDGKIGWRKFALRSQDSLHSWITDKENGGLLGMRQQAWNDYKIRDIPIEKMLLYRTTSEKGNPEGRSILRPAYPSYYYVKNLQAVEAIGAERDLAGLPMINLPEGANTDSGSTDLNNAEQIVRRVRQDEQAGAVIPFGWTFSLLSSPGAKQVDIGALIERYEKRIAMVMMAQFLMLGMDKVGSYSLSKDHSDFFLMAISAIADIITETFNKYAIPRLLKLNGLSTIHAPKLVHGVPSEPDLTALGEFLSKLGSGGFIKPDDEMEKELRSLANLPELTQEMIDERQAKAEEMKRNLQPDTGQPGQPVDPDEKGKLGEKPPSKPGDGAEMGDGNDMIAEMLKKMSIRQQVEVFVGSSNVIRQRIKTIPDDRTRKAIQSGSKDLVDLNRDIMKDKLASLKGITDEEWAAAVETDAAKEHANGHP